MISEGIVTTLNEDGTPNVSPMGPEVDDDGSSDIDRLILKPFQTSKTYQNLKRQGEGVFHVTDDVLMLARAATNRLPTTPATQPATVVDGVALQDSCRWYEFRVTALDDSKERTRIECDVVHCGRLRDFFGFNRAKHAILEGAILATRVAFLPPNEIRAEFERLSIIVHKTAGKNELKAFIELEDYVRTTLAGIDS